MQFIIQLGLNLVKIHRGVKFVQSNWLQPYINKNVCARKLAQDEFQSSIEKLKCNAIFGKTIQNVRNQMNVKLVTSKDKLNKIINKKSFKEFRIFNKTLVACHMEKEEIFLNQPVIVGFTILDLSKWFFYRTYYVDIKSKLSNVRLMYGDTDSLLICLENEDIYDFIKNNIHMFDTSNFDKNHPLYDDKKKRNLGLLKVENGSQHITSFIALKSKMYSLKLANDSCKSTAKGIKKCVIKKQLKHVLYESCLKEGLKYYFEMKNIRHYRQKLFTESNVKLSLSNYDSKRYILLNGIDTLAYGHYKIPYI